MNTKRVIKLSTFVLMLLVVLYSCNSQNNSDKKNNSESKEQLTLVKNLEHIAENILSKDHNIDMTQFTKTVLEIPYAGTNNVHQTLDITYPGNGKAPYKTIILFHGGGWVGGNKQTAGIACVFQATTQGYAIVSVNYRFSNEILWPKPLYDAKAAIRFIRANADKYNLDTKNIVVWGGSAGGHIVEMLGATNNLPAFEDLTMGNKKASSAVQGVVAWYGVADLTTLTDAGTPPANRIMGFDVRLNKAKTHNANPIELVTAQYPPILLVHGTNDKMVPYQQSVDMQKKVNEATGSQTAELITFYGAGHGDNVIKTNDNVAKCLDFVDKIEYQGNNPYRNTNYINLKIKQ